MKKLLRQNIFLLLLLAVVTTFLTFTAYSIGSCFLMLLACIMAAYTGFASGELIEIINSAFEDEE